MVTHFRTAGGKGDDYTLYLIFLKVTVTSTSPSFI